MGDNSVRDGYNRTMNISNLKPWPFHDPKQEIKELLAKMNESMLSQEKKMDCLIQEIEGMKRIVYYSPPSQGGPGYNEAKSHFEQDGTGSVDEPKEKE